MKAQKPQNKELIGQEVAVLKELKAALEKALAQAASAVPVVSGDAPPSNTLPSDIDQLQKMVTDQVGHVLFFELFTSEARLVRGTKGFQMKLMS